MFSPFKFDKHHAFKRSGLGPFTSTADKGFLKLDLDGKPVWYYLCRRCQAKFVARWRTKALNRYPILVADVNGSEPIRKYSKDAEIVDYDYQVLEGCSFSLRGPLEVVPEKKTVTCLGSAATFGRFVRRPFTHILADSNPWNVVNLGFGGARFETYLSEPAALDVCKKSDLVVLELMSARSYNSHIFEAKDHLGGFGCLAKKYTKKIEKRDPSSTLLSDNVYINEALKWAAENLEWADLQRARAEILRSYQSDAIRLIQAIDRPVVLLWFSQRSPDKKPRPGTSASWSRGFPHFVDRKTIEFLEQYAVGVVEVVSKAGIPSELTSIRDGKPVSKLRQSRVPTLNRYYPSPEMHIEAARKLAERIEEIL